MKRVILTLFFIGSLFAVQSQELNVGLRFQKTYQMYWENGISAQYSFANFQPKRLYVGFDYVTSRFGTAINSNALKQDNLIFSGSWFFNPNKPFHFLVRLNMGYFNADLEEEIFKTLPHSAFLLAPEVGFTYDIKNTPLRLNLGSGYYFDFAEEGHSPGTLYPFYYHLDIYYKIFNNKNHD